MSWQNLPTDDLKEASFDNYMDKLAAPLPEAPRPMEETKLIDLAAEGAAPKTYLPDEHAPKPFSKKKEDGFSMAPPVDVYEPGFRTDLKDAILTYFKRQRAIKEKNAQIRAKIGLR